MPVLDSLKRLQSFSSVFSRKGPVSAKPEFKLPPYPQQGNTLVPLFTPKEIFSAELAVIRKAEKGDALWVAIYEQQNAKINGKDRLAKGQPGYEEQQLLVPEIEAAKKRGAQVHEVIDASDGWGKPSENLPLIDYLGKKGIEVRPYPTKVAKINHSKNVVLAHRAGNGNVEYWGVGAGGMNMGNHSAANHDTMVLMAGTAPYNMLVHVIRPQWIVSGGNPNDLPSQEIPDKEVRWVNTSPSEEPGGGTPEVKRAYLDLIRLSRKLKDQGLRPIIRTAQFVLSNPAVVLSLRDAAREGVTVKALIDPNMYVESMKSSVQRLTGLSDSDPINHEVSLHPDKFMALLGARDVDDLEDQLVCLHSNEGREMPLNFAALDRQAVEAYQKGALKFKPAPVWARDEIMGAGGTVKFFDADTKIGQKLHDKWIALSYLDSSGREIPVMLVSGSANASKAGLEPNEPKARFRRNREADAVITNKDLVKAYTDMFDDLLANKSTDTPPAGSGQPDVF